MKASRTRLQAYQTIMAAIKAGTCDPGKMGGFCRYKLESGYTGVNIVLNCGVGALFNEGQLQWIIDNGCNATTIDTLAENRFIGKKNIEYATGLKISELQYLQERHDSGTDRRRGGVLFKEWITKIINDIQVDPTLDYHLEIEA